MKTFRFVEIFFLTSFALTCSTVEGSELFLCQNSSLSEGETFVTSGLKVFLYQDDEPVAFNEYFSIGNTTSNCRETGQVYQFPANEKLDFTPSGHLGVRFKNTSMIQWRWYNKNEYCLGRTGNTLDSIRLLDCSTGLQKPQLEITKCCAPGYAFPEHFDPYEDMVKSCASDAQAPEWSIQLYNSTTVNSGDCIEAVDNVATKFSFVTLTKSIVVKDTDVLALAPRKTVVDQRGETTAVQYRWRLLDNGTFVKWIDDHPSWTPGSGRWSVVPHQVLCFENMMLGNGLLGKTQVLLMKIELPGNGSIEEDTEESEASGGCHYWTTPSVIVVAVCFVIAAVVLTAAVVALVVAKKRAPSCDHVVQGSMLLVPLLVLLVVNNVLYATSHLTSACSERPYGFCVSIGMAAISMRLSTILWLICTNFNIWVHFVGGKTQIRTLVTEAAVGLIPPAIFVLHGYMLDIAYGEFGTDSDCTRWLPRFGVFNCYVEHSAEGAYVYYPQIVLLLVSAGVLGFTIVRMMWGHREGSRILADHCSMWLRQYAKIFAVLVVSFGLEFGLWIFDESLDTSPWVVVISVVGILGEAFAILGFGVAPVVSLLIQGSCTNQGYRAASGSARFVDIPLMPVND